MGLHIRSVDDEPLARARLRTRLGDCTNTELGPAITRITDAGHAGEALELLQHTAVDVVLLDIHMPGMDGIQLAKALRSMGQQAPAIVFVTAHAEHPRSISRGAQAARVRSKSIAARACVANAWRTHPPMTVFAPQSPMAGSRALSC